MPLYINVETSALLIAPNRRSQAAMNEDDECFNYINANHRRASYNVYRLVGFNI